MNFPDPVVIVHPSAADEYGNPGADFTSPVRDASKKGFYFEKAYQTGTFSGLLLPPDAVIAESDRVEVRGKTYSVSFVTEVRAPGRTIMWNVTLQELR